MNIDCTGQTRINAEKCYSEPSNIYSDLAARWLNSLLILDNYYFVVIISLSPRIIYDKAKFHPLADAERLQIWQLY